MGTMHLSEEIGYPDGPDAVARLLHDEDFVTEVWASGGATRIEVKAGGQPAGEFEVETERDFPTDGFPDFARPFVGTGITIVQCDRWQAPEADGTRRGTMTVSMGKLPVRVTGTSVLSPGEGGCVQTVEAEITASVPFLGRKIEQAAAPMLVKALRHQAKVAARRLS